MNLEHRGNLLCLEEPWCSAVIRVQGGSTREIVQCLAMVHVQSAMYGSVSADLWV